MNTAIETVEELAARGVETARRLGADQAEAFVTAACASEVEIQKDDIQNAGVAEETTLGIRVIRAGSVGCACVNAPARLEQACADALATAAAAPPDPLNGLGAARPVQPLDRKPDPAIAALGIGDLVEEAALLLDRVASRDARVRLDSGSVFASTVTRTIATSEGIVLTDRRALAGGSLFGMAVDGDDVGSFDHDGHTVLRAASLRAELEAAADRFVIKTAGALGAGKGASFRGTVILSPETVHGFLLGNLLQVMSARAVRTGRSPLADRRGTPIATPAFHLVDDPRLPDGTASAAFDREGMPTAGRVLIDRGVLQEFLYDVYEARAAEREPTGHARGGAASQPAIGPSNLVLEAGPTPFATLCAEPERAVLVSRFSGSTNPVTGDFSGVVKGGFLLHAGERKPLKETLISGNLFDLLQRISGVSREIRNIEGRARIPALRVEDVSVTAG